MGLRKWNTTNQNAVDFVSSCLSHSPKPFCIFYYYSKQQKQRIWFISIITESFYWSHYLFYLSCLLLLTTVHFFCECGYLYYKFSSCKPTIYYAKVPSNSIWFLKKMIFLLVDNIHRNPNGALFFSLFI